MYASIDRQVILLIYLYRERSPWADPGIYFLGPNIVPQSKAESETRVKGAKHLRIEGEAPNRG